MVNTITLSRGANALVYATWQLIGGDIRRGTYGNLRVKVRVPFTFDVHSFCTLTYIRRIIPNMNSSITIPMTPTAIQREDCKRGSDHQNVIELQISSSHTSLSQERDT